jgi:hypothetical protein
VTSLMPRRWRWIRRHIVAVLLRGLRSADVQRTEHDGDDQDGDLQLYFLDGRPHVLSSAKGEDRGDATARDEKTKESGAHALTVSRVRRNRLLHLRAVLTQRAHSLAKSLYFFVKIARANECELFSLEPKEALCN